jgi:hypothetical protein
MLQLQPPCFLPLPRCRIPGSSSSRRRRARPSALAFRSQWKLPDVDTGERAASPRRRFRFR